MQLNTNPEQLHKSLCATAPRALSFANATQDEAWRDALKDKLSELLGMPAKPDSPPAMIIEWEKKHETYNETRFLVESEQGYNVPCHLLMPLEINKPCPVIICLQGHSSGMHISLGRPGGGLDAEHIRGGRDFALQIVGEKYAAVVMEQRGFGECEGSPAEASEAGRCHLPAMQALMLGRTMLGERVFDVSRVIDALSGIAGLDTGRIACMGNSGGGTATWYAACMDERISVAMPSCSVCSYEGSIIAMYHCQCNYLPHVLAWFEMADLAGLIAPRKLVVVAGAEDDIFPIDATRQAYATIEQIYANAKIPGQCRLVVGAGGHRFYPEEAWPVFRELSGW